MREKVLIMSSVHLWNDTRIFYKMAKSLAKVYDVELHAVADFDHQQVDNVQVFGLPKYTKRYLRPLNWLRLLYRTIQSDAKIVHFHDPELLLLGLVLKILTRKKVIYDVHEDFPASILNKNWIQRQWRTRIASLADRLEKGMSKHLDGIVFAEFYYKENFTRVHTRKVDIVNYPVFSDERCEEKKELNPDPTVRLVYAGGISESRGAFNMIKAIGAMRSDIQQRVQLILIGDVSGPMRAELESLMAAEGVEEHVLLTGRVNLAQVYEYYANCQIGLAILYPEKNYVKSLATKIYEYMSVGIPIIASNFPLWVELVEGNGCGVNVDPLDVQALARTMEELVVDPNRCHVMGRNGFAVYKEKYNWNVCEHELLKLYQELLEG